MAKPKTATAKARERAAIRRDLIAQTEERGCRSPWTDDQINRYLVLRDEAVGFEEALSEARTADDEERQTRMASGLSECSLAMAAILDALQVAPQSTRRAELEADVLAQLGAQNLVNPVFRDKVDQFLLLWDANQAAHKALRGKGRTYFTVSSAGKTYEKDNSACKDITAYPKAMDEILKSMGVTVTGYADPEDDAL